MLISKQKSLFSFNKSHGMKLIIQIPCYNEEETLGIALSLLPRKVKGFDKVEWLIINDGSTDNTLEAAQKGGADHIVNFFVMKMIQDKSVYECICPL